MSLLYVILELLKTLHELNLRKLIALNDVIEIQRELQKVLNQRNIWVKPQTQKWWNEIFLKKYSREFYEFMRMDWDTFTWIKEKLEPELKTENTQFRKAITVEKRLPLVYMF